MEYVTHQQPKAQPPTFGGIHQEHTIIPSRLVCETGPQEILETFLCVHEVFGLRVVQLELSDTSQPLKYMQEPIARSTLEPDSTAPAT